MLCNHEQYLTDEYDLPFIFKEKLHLHSHFEVTFFLFVAKGFLKPFNKYIIISFVISIMIKRLCRICVQSCAIYVVEVVQDIWGRYKQYKWFYLYIISRGNCTEERWNLDRNGHGSCVKDIKFSLLSKLSLLSIEICKNWEPL